MKARKRIEGTGRWRPPCAPPPLPAEVRFGRQVRGRWGCERSEAWARTSAGIQYTASTPALQRSQRSATTSRTRGAREARQRSLYGKATESRQARGRRGGGGREGTEEDPQRGATGEATEPSPRPARRAEKEEGGGGSRHQWEGRRCAVQRIGGYLQGHFRNFTFTLVCVPDLVHLFWDGGSRNDQSIRELDASTDAGKRKTKRSTALPHTIT
ncbi:unnamed protein product [Urochloa humidicola]